MFFLALSSRGSSFVVIFCKSCVHFDFTQLAIHMIQRFMIQGCPTLICIFWCKVYYYSFCILGGDTHLLAPLIQHFQLGVVYVNH